MPIRWTAGVVVALLAMLLAAGSAGATTWSPPVTISAPGEENNEADLAVARDGTAIAVWRRADCSNPDPTDHVCENRRIQYAVRPPGGSFAPPVAVPGDPGTGSTSPQVAVDAAGNALVVWLSASAPTGDLRLRYSLRPAGGSFGAARSIADATAEFHAFPSLAMAPTGRAVVVFKRFAAGALETAYAVRNPGGEFGPVIPVAGDPGAGDFLPPAVELDDTGAGIAAWTSSTPGQTSIRIAQIAAGADEFDPVETLAQGLVPSLAMSPAGAAVLTWIATGSELSAAFRAPGGSFGAPAAIPVSGTLTNVNTAIDPLGRVVIGWSAFAGGSVRSSWVTSPFGGPFGAPSPISPDQAGLNDLIASDQGATLALLVDPGVTAPSLRASLRPPGGSFGAPVVLPGPPQGVSSFGATAAFDASGSAVALWSGSDPLSQEPHDVPLLASVLDPTEPPKPEKPTTPRIEGLSVKPKRFFLGEKPTARASAATTGTTVRFRLSEPSTVRLQVERRKPGVAVRAKGKLRCLPVTPANLERGTGKRCALFRPAGLLTRRDLPAGPSQVRFSGRIGRKALTPGRHRFVVTAVNKAGNGSEPRRTPFTVLDALQRNR